VERSISWTKTARPDFHVFKQKLKTILFGLGYSWDRANIFLFHALYKYALRMWVCICMYMHVSAICNVRSQCSSQWNSLSFRPTPLQNPWTDFDVASISTSPWFFVLAFHEELEYCNFNEYFKSGGGLSTSCRNLVSFGPLTPEIMRLYNMYSGIHQYAGVSLTEFVRGWHCQALWRSVIELLSLLFTRRDAAWPGGLHARFCHAFLVKVRNFNKKA